MSKDSDYFICQLIVRSLWFAGTGTVNLKAGPVIIDGVDQHVVEAVSEEAGTGFGGH